ncbi:hypothetical protein OIU91_16435 [Streptomyces sp. NBC_01456]|uniref:hypothetical protein n=1 Tax=Streptomyces sp. NBC_01456 TaxID=2975868 RepID=UPI002E30BF86|nr:hypothetical protein [Streptomyces sp. NBC_01456]
MAIVVQGYLKCPGCREYVIEADEEQYPDGVDYETPGADESKTKCRMCRVHEDGSDEECEPDCSDCKENKADAEKEVEAEHLRQPADTRRISNSAIRHVGRPRWVAYYERAIDADPQSGRRRVGLLVPRSSGRSQIAHAYDGTLMEFPIGLSPTGSHGAWYTAHANELPREQWQAIRTFWTDLQSRSTHQGPSPVVASSEEPAA